jgi:adenylylsulfate kinase-like enzyme
MIHLSDDSVFKTDHIEIDQETNAIIPKPEMGYQLRLVDGDELRDGLGLNDDTVFDEQIDAISRAYPEFCV